jgi:hypothetical protein
VLNSLDGHYLRKLGDEDWAPRKTVSFMLPLGGDGDDASGDGSGEGDCAGGGNGSASSGSVGTALQAAGATPRLLVGFGAPLGTVASGAVAVEHEVAKLLPLRDRHAKAKSPKGKSGEEPLAARARRLDGLGATARAVPTAAAGTQPAPPGQLSAAAEDPHAPVSVESPAWGLECAHACGGNVAMGTDNGLVVVSSAGGTSRRRVLDACSLAGVRPASHKVAALQIADDKVFVALQASAGDATAGGFQGKLLCFDLVPDNVPDAMH